MSKAPMKTDVELGDIEEDAEKAVAGAIEEAVPAELQAPALSTMDAVLAEAMSSRGDAQVITPDGRYIVVRGRLWRCANPKLSHAERERLTHALMDARRVTARVRRTGKGDLAAARAAVDQAKVALGERGPVWWDDGSPDYNRRMAANTPYQDWYASLG